MKSFLGVPYPVTKSTRGYFYSQSGINQIKSDLLVLLLTNPGERCMNPNFGTPLRQLTFEPNDPTLQLQAKNMIANSISQWEPRVAIQQITVTSNIPTNVLNPSDTKTNLENILYISIFFVDPGNIKQVQQLVLEVPIAGGS